MGEKCSSHGECDIGLSCRHNREWPYNTECLTQRQIGEDCVDDGDCEIHLKCWYPTANHVANQTRQCMTAYGLQDGAKFGF